ncbi:hypothetical protein CR513_31174, partial [Mucuna pruriens]
MIMPLTRNQASSTNEVASLQERSDEQSWLSAEAVRRQMEAEERHCQAEEWHLKAMKMAKQREEELRQQITIMKAATEKVRGLVQEVDIHALWRQPFSEEINRTPIPTNFRELVVDPFDGTQDPHSHLQAFQTQMYNSGGSDALNCKLFLDTLRGVAMQWLSILLAWTIQSFKDLAVLFVSQFIANKAKRLEVADLFDIRQAKGENLKSYLARFNNVMVRVNDSEQKFFVKAFQKGLQAG